MLLGLLVLITAVSGCADAARERLGLALAPPISLAMIVHGADGDPFWAEVRAGAEDAALAFDVNLLWRSTPDPEERVRLVDEVVQQGFDVLVVTLSDPEAMSDVVREAALIGLTVYVINVGAELAARWGADGYFGQNETVAGLAVGDRFAQLGAEHLLCVRHEPDNVALETRCKRAGSRLERLTTLALEPDADVRTAIELALAADRSIDAVLTMNVSIMNQAMAAISSSDSAEPGGRLVMHGVFELNLEVLDAIEDGRLEFAVDQQPYLQGYLPVAYSRLVQYSELTQGDEVADAFLQWIAGGGVLMGPAFVDAHNAPRVREAIQAAHDASSLGGQPAD